MESTTIAVDPATRTARLNTLRGLLRERGFAIPVGAPQGVPSVSGLVSDAGLRTASGGSGWP
jgi:hypothetical protein